MVKTVLVEQDLDEGRRLLDAFDDKEAERPVTWRKSPTAAISHARARVQAAFWQFLPESLEWRLVVATPLVDEIGPLSVYSKIQADLGKIKPPLSLTLQNISVISPKDERVKMLRKSMKIVSGAPRGRFSASPVIGAYIDDSYIYRLQ